MDKKIDILIVDDHPLALFGFKEMFSRETDLNIAGTATDGKTAIEMALALKPDITLSIVKNAVGKCRKWTA